MRMTQTHSATRIVFTLLGISIALLVAGGFITGTTTARVESPARRGPFKLIIQGPRPTPTPCCSDDNKPHTLVGSYYSVKNNSSTTLLLNNKGPRPLEVFPTLFSKNGERFDVPAVTVEPESFRMIDLRPWVRLADRSQFKEGNIQVFHRGRDLVLGAQLYVTDERHSLSFDEKLVETGTFKSSKLEGLWWVPSPSGDVRLVLSNTSNLPLTISIEAEGKTPERNGNTTATLNGHETRVIDVQADLFNREHGAMSRLGGISLQHSGLPGALLARGMALDAVSGYSLPIQFSDPATGKSAKLQGAGLRVGRVGNDTLKPIVVARNIGNASTTVTGRLPYTAADGTPSVAELAPFELSPGEIKAVDIRHALHQQGQQQLTAIGGLEFEYSSAPGSVLITAFSISDDDNQVFRVPMWDVIAQRSATGGYPWRIEGNSSTTIYIKNAETHDQHYYLQMRYPGGVYSVGIKSIAAGETVSYDMRRLRDEQIPDAAGHVIPLDATSGQVHWSKTGNEVGMLIGRSEQADLQLGVSSNYACANCCPDNAANPRVVPSTANKPVGQTQNYVAQQQLTTCYGSFTSYMDVFISTWSSSDDGIATVSVGLATAVAPGTATLTAQWHASHFSLVDDAPPGPGGIEPFGGQSSCQITGLDDMSATATFEVKPRIDSISPNYGVPGAVVHATINGAGFDSNSTVQVTGTGVTVNVTNRQATSIAADFTIAANATAQTINVTVTTATKVSAASTFEVRIPDHLEVISDNGNSQVRGDCPVGQPVVRRISLRVVDVSGNPVGDITVQEHFLNVSTNTCHPNGSGPIPSPCATTDGSGNLTDTITVNCNNVLGSCGYTITYQWQWCPSGASAVTLATLSQTVHHNQVTINGNTSGFAAGTGMH